MRQMFHLFLFKVVFGFLQVSLLMFHFNLPAQACCDNSPQPEVMARSPCKKYAAIITPRYHIRSNGSLPFEIYQDHIILTFAVQTNEEGKIQDNMEVE